MDKTQILIVESKPGPSRQLQELLDAPDLHISATAAAEAALRLAISHDFALAIVTLALPDATGALDLARRLRAEGLNRQLPIIFVSGPRHGKQVIFDGYEQGAVDVLIRPLEPHIVRSKVRVFVELHQSKIVIKRKLREVRRLAAQAEEANQLKSRFLANISHEFRTPLSAILGHAELLFTHQQDDATQRQYLGSIIQNGQLLTEIINNVLDLSKIEAGLLMIERLTFPLDELLNDLRLTFGREASQKGLRFEVIKNTDVKLVTTDPTRLRQVLYNLVGNALKFTSEGSVEVEVRMTAVDGRSMLEFLVRDTGCGLESTAAVTLFKPFNQADTSTTRRFGGTGLGLSIARHLAHALGGEVTLVETGLGRGSRFSVTVDPTPAPQVSLSRLEATIVLPQVAANHDATGAQVDGHGAYGVASEAAPRLDNVRILMVEDSKHIRSFVRRVLELSGAQVDEADGGEQALVKAKPQAYDVILMDIQMPGMDGYEATRLLRERGFTLPIVAFTAHALKEERDRCLQGGFDTHITKPIEHQKLISTLATLTKRIPARPSL